MHMCMLALPQQVRANVCTFLANDYLVDACNVVAAYNTCFSVQSTSMKAWTVV
jgi:hypothetical protein